MALSVHVVCANFEEDRILPRMARMLRDRLGWTLSASIKEAGSAEALFFGVYFDVSRLTEWPSIPVAAYFTHREEEPAGTVKAKVFDEMAKKVALRIVTARMYGEMVEPSGPTVQVHAPVERERFTIPERAEILRPREYTGPQNDKRVVGLSGYTYANKRKGEDLVRGLLASKLGKSLEWRACGRGWPVPTKQLAWAEMPAFYQGLDVLVVPSRVEGVPMPPLEAMACGVSVVVPWHVGMLDELGEVQGIYRYERGDAQGMLAALQRAVAERAEVDREALRAATEGYSVEAWCGDIERAMEMVCGEKPRNTRNTRKEEEREGPEPELAAPFMAGVESNGEDGGELPAIVWEEPVERGTGSTRGIYCVAFGGPARSACEQMMRSAKRHMPDIPIALCAASPIGPEDLLIEQPDSDIGGRRAKLRAYELAPAEWQSVLYLDADIKVIAPVYRFFEWVEDGWELAICTDVPPNDLLEHIGHKTLVQEARETQRIVGTGMALQFNGGVWSFGRGPQVEAFFKRWRAEWERWGAKDQGALLRAYHTVPLKTWVLGNEWNCFPRFQPNQESAGVLHFPGDARRWTGQIRGRIDSEEAWQAVERFEAKKR